MTRLDRAINFNDPAGGAAPVAIYTDWAASFGRSERTDTRMYAFALLGGLVVQDNTYGLGEEGTEAVLLDQLGTQMRALEHVKEKEGWPGTAWRSVRASLGSRSFIRSLRGALIALQEDDWVYEDELNQATSGVVPFAFDADWAISFAQSEMTDTEKYGSALLGGIEVEGATYESLQDVVEAPLLAQLKAKLVALEQTKEEERWPGAVWPNAQAFSDAYSFIRGLRGALVPVPEIYLADDGEVNFLWKHGGVHIDLGFYGTGTCSYFARGKYGRKFHGEDVPASKGLPAEIAALFTA